jgi:rhodanese-related sulfurtransferase
MEKSPQKQSTRTKRRLDVLESEVNKPQRKIKFDLTFEQPSLFDENSCDSGFSDIKDDCDELTFKSFDSLDDTQIETTSDLFNHNLNIESPFALYNANSSANKNVRRFKLKSKSFNVALPCNPQLDEIAVAKSLEKAETCTGERLIGDMTRHHTLPILKRSKHQDLASISSTTLNELIKGSYSNEIGEFLILDARYPYEFEGGHIDGAQSAFNKDSLFNRLFSNPIKSADGKPVILVFHCEFSANRGPRLMRELRERDRVLNKQNYPNLHYPEIYLLEGGYKSFFETHNDSCSPKTYMPMLHDNHRNELKYFRKKSKTWELTTSTSAASIAVSSKPRATPSKKTKLMF